jgi:hypothetical protein
MTQPKYEILVASIEFVCALNLYEMRLQLGINLTNFRFIFNVSRQTFECYC